MGRRDWNLAGGCLLISLLAGADPVGATLITVPGDQPTIQAGINAAVVGDTVLLAPGVFTGAGNFDLAFGGKDIVLRGAAAPDSSAIDCAGENSAFYFNDGETAAARIERLTIKNADSYAIHLYLASASLRDIRVFDCGRGLAFNTSTSFIEGFFCARTRSALDTYGATLTVSDMTVVGGPGESVIEVGNSGHMEIDGLTVSACRGQYSIVYCRGSLVLRNAYFHRNWLGTMDARGVISGEGDGTSLDLADLTFVDNATDAIHTRDACTLTLRSTTIVNAGGEGLELSSETVADVAQTIVAFGDKVGIHAWPGCALTLSCSDVWANATGDYGGAIVDPTGTNGMLKADPMFCAIGGPEAPPTLSIHSPCAPANNDCGLLIGAQDTDCALEMVTVSGAVRDVLSQPVAEVAVNGFYYPVATDTAGAYAFAAVQGWSGVLHPVKDGLHFAPTDLPIPPLAADLPAQDFLAFVQTAIAVPGDFPDLAAALYFALDGDTILVAPGTYSGPANRDLSFAGKDLVLLGLGGPGAVVIDCEGMGRAFLFDGGESAAALLAGLTIRNGQGPNGHTPPYDSGGGICVRGASPTLRDLVIEDCRSEEWGGGLMLAGAGSLVERVHCRRNEAAAALGIGGGACVSGGAVTLQQCLFTSNFARRFGGGLFVESGTILVDGCTVFGNTAGWSGGGIGSFDSENPPELVIVRSLVAANHATGGGALYHHGAWPAPSYVCCLFWDNDSPLVWGSILDPVGSGGNIAADPLLCDPEAGDFGLLPGSPCLPPNNSCGELIGAFGEGCGRQATGGRR